MTRRQLWAAGLAAALAFAGCRAEPNLPADAPTQAQPDAPDVAPSGLEVVPVTVRTASAAHTFRAEVARTAEEQARGLMFRESLAPDAAMIFPFPQPRLASFWMRNTMIPLDMIFIRADGTIANIERETEPYSLDSRPSEGPVAAVLEIAGGRAAELGIEPGDTVSWPGGPQQ